MKNIKIKLIILFLGINISAQAQLTNAASGGDASGSGGTVAYSVGQVVYTTNTNLSGSISQGVQQAYEILIIGIEEFEMNISLSVFPNPTSDNLNLIINDYNNENLSLQLFDMQGKLLFDKQVTEMQTQVNISNLPSATYFIHIKNHESNKVQLFKIIKNQ